MRVARITVGLLAALCSLIVGAEMPAVSANDSGTSASTDTVSIGGAEIYVGFESGELGLPRGALLNWVGKSACAVTEYYGRFPVQKVNVRIAAIGEGSGVLAGRTIVIDGIPWVRIAVSQFATKASLGDDWIMTHEMVHLAFPSVVRQHHWIEEGIATYVEPIARAQIDDLPPERVWRDLLDGLPRGLPAPGDQGLDNTHTWGRTYWGGALFCLWRTSRFTGARTIDSGSRMRCGESSVPAATWTTTGRSRARSKPETTRSACQSSLSCTTR